MKLASRLVECRKSKGVTQKGVALGVGISERGYQRYETQEREPTIGILIALADFFGVSLDYLVGRSDDPGR